MPEQKPPDEYETFDKLVDNITASIGILVEHQLTEYFKSIPETPQRAIVLRELRDEAYADIITAAFKQINHPGWARAILAYEKEKFDDNLRRFIQDRRALEANSEWELSKKVKLDHKYIG